MEMMIPSTLNTNKYYNFNFLKYSIAIIMDKYNLQKSFND